MAMTPKLEMRQGQSLSLTPQLLQAIKLLQLSQADLITFIEEELEKNPLLNVKILRKKTPLNLKISGQAQQMAIGLNTRLILIQILKMFS